MRPIAVVALLVACAPEPSGPEDLLEKGADAPDGAGLPAPLPPPPTFVLQVPDEIVVGVPFLLGVGGTLGQSEHVYVFAGSGPGAGPCPIQLGGECLDIVGGPVLVAHGYANANGTWVDQVTVPVAVGARNLAFQAVVVRGINGSESVVSNVETAVTVLQAPGCVDPSAENYDPLANVDDGSCTWACVPDVGIGPVPPALSLSTADVTIAMTGVTSVAYAGDLDGDGFGDLVVGVAGDSGAAASAGAAYVFLGPFVSGNLTAANAHAVLQGAAADARVGAQVVGGGDLDGDGADDLVIASGPYFTTPAVSVFYGPIASGTRSVATADATFTAEAAGYAGTPGALDLGDVSGDGRDDLVVGVQGASPGGAVYAFTTVRAGTASLATADVVIRGTTGGLGAAAAIVGDTDGDGANDLLVGAPWESTGAFGYGAAYLYEGPFAGVVSPSSWAARFTATSARQYVGQSVAGPGDVDGDGLADLVVGGPSTDMDAMDSRGDAFVFLGGVSGDLDTTQADFPIVGVSTYNYFGTMLLTPGDLDGDGLDDLIVQSWGDDADVATPRAGSYYVFHAPVCGDDANDADLVVRGTAAYQWTVGTASGDLTGDGISDLVVAENGGVRIVSGTRL